jgi:sec-independent protein translocase protein TatC
MKAGRPISHEDELNIVGHLDELRSRLMVCAAFFVVALGIAFTFNHQLLRLMNAPLNGDYKPVTFAVSEAFMTTITVCAYAAIVLVLPVLLYEAYAFLAPVASPDQRKATVPLLLMAPLLFIGGAAFAYLVVIPAALKFLLGFNSGEFNLQLRASDYYSFVAMTLASMGLLFQVPVVAVGASRLGIVTPRQMREKRRVAIVVAAVIAMLLPGTDPVTMLLCMLPLLVLYELSIVLAAFFGRARNLSVSTEPLAGAH